MTEHTKGPWRVSRSRPRRVQTEGGMAVCTAILRNVETPAGAARVEAEAQANAQLIASSPRMLEVLKSANSWLERWGQHAGNCVMPACTCGLELARYETETAIAQAEGRA